MYLGCIWVDLVWIGVDIRCTFVDITYTFPKFQQALKLAESREKQVPTFFAFLPPYIVVTGLLAYLKRQILKRSIDSYQKFFISCRLARYWAVFVFYVSQKSIENLSKIYRKSIEHLSNIYRNSIELLSKIYRKSRYLKGI